MIGSFKRRRHARTCSFISASSQHSGKVAFSPEALSGDVAITRQLHLSSLEKSPSRQKLRLSSSTMSPSHGQLRIPSVEAALCLHLKPSGHGVVRLSLQATLHLWPSRHDDAGSQL
jgi:hypothetical protein